MRTHLLLLSLCVVACVGPGPFPGEPGADGSVTGGGVAGTSGGAGGAGGTLPDGGALPDARCAPEEERPEWRWRVLLIPEWSRQMCVLDPPGIEESSGGCQEILSLVRQRPVPGRVTALEAFVNRFSSMNDGGVLVLPPPYRRPESFSQSTTPVVLTILRGLQARLNGPADYQTTLTDARDIIEADLRTMPERLRSRTRYMLILVGSGLPGPRCSSNDTLPMYASGTRPELVWADSNAVICNQPADQQTTPFDQPVALRPGGPWNQNDELLTLASDLVSVGRFYGAASVELHTRLAVSERAIAACGSRCDPFWPGGVQGSQVRAAGSWLLRRLAERGNGTFVDPGEPENLSLTELASKPVQTFCVD